MSYTPSPVTIPGNNKRVMPTQATRDPPPQPIPNLEASRLDGTTGPNPNTNHNPNPEKDYTLINSSNKT